MALNHIHEVRLWRRVIGICSEKVSFGFTGTVGETQLVVESLTTLLKDRVVFRKKSKNHQKNIDSLDRWRQGEQLLLQRFLQALGRWYQGRLHRAGTGQPNLRFVHHGALTRYLEIYETSMYWISSAFGDVWNGCFERESHWSFPSGRLSDSVIKVHSH